jgi:hypothetical protein
MRTPYTCSSPKGNEASLKLQDLRRTELQGRLLFLREDRSFVGCRFCVISSLPKYGPPGSIPFKNLLRYSLQGECRMESQKFFR